VKRRAEEQRARKEQEEEKRKGEKEKLKHEGVKRHRGWIDILPRVAKTRKHMGTEELTGPHEKARRL